MFRTFAWVLVLAQLLSPAAASAEDRIGFVDSGTVLQRHPDRPAAEESMRAFRAELDARMAEMRAEHTSRVNAFRAAQDAGQPDQALFDSVKAYEEQIDAFLDESQSEIERRESDLMQPMVDDANRVIARIAEAEGFTCVLDTSSGAVVYIDTANDITIRAIQSLRAEAEAESAASPGSDEDGSGR